MTPGPQALHGRGTGAPGSQFYFNLSSPMERGGCHETIWRLVSRTGTQGRSALRLAEEWPTRKKATDQCEVV